MYVNLPLSAQTSYAQLLEAVTSRELRRTVNSLSGSFTAKRIGGSTYWYYTYRLPDAGVQQAFVGPDSERMCALIEASKREPQEDSAPLLARGYLSMGGSPAIAQQVSLLRHLSDAGFFRAGGVLVGTHAFLSYANVLGARWAGHDQTTDVDLDWSDRSVSIALPAAPKVDINDALTTFESGFVPAFILGKGISRAYKSSTDEDFRVDFLTPLSKGGAGDIRLIKSLNISAQPLPFMEFSLETPIQTAIIDRRGRSVLANVPPPARFALHKLIVSNLRGNNFRVKVAKDIAQAATLLLWFADHEPEAIIEARENAWARGPAWRKNLKAGWERLAREYPAISKKFDGSFGTRNKSRHT